MCALTLLVSCAFSRAALHASLEQLGYTVDVNAIWLPTGLQTGPVAPPLSDVSCLGFEPSGAAAPGTRARTCEMVRRITESGKGDEKCLVSIEVQDAAARMQPWAPLRVRSSTGGTPHVQIPVYAQQCRCPSGRHGRERV